MAEGSSSTDDNKEIVTMCDFLQEEEDLEENANAVLGGSDDTYCSYDKGYVSRQALYACLSCAENKESGGICLACCYACHDGHEVVELYTKRNFRCDCGNNKFPGKLCSLRPNKENINSKNKYNQNFKGVYCTCSRPYPDLDDDIPDEMIQCIICEDWYHGRHLGGEVPEEYFEMVCSKCMESHCFLYAYLNKFNCVQVEDELKPDLKACENSPSTLKVESVAVKKENEETKTNDHVASNGTGSSVENIVTNGIKAEPQEISSIKNEISSSCILRELKNKEQIFNKGPAFFPENWRKELCSCMSCMSMYSDKDCQYLTNLDDTVKAYEDRGKLCSNESQYDKGLNALNKLDRVAQMEAISAYTDMKGQLKEYLKDFADNKRTVCESDIKEFFDQIRKKQKTNTGVPYFCR
ncbi:LOW QUALITY PROTEIN: putative E3 ubiquitin-protein ligase UBR7 [Uloborus diversus]|uniref:LOW QUALITY PROTEIN: putative E3 ubiquitin-protein ligase UBR7 n=1 Tax=Uloborus diversus TaxID=327109 RepID=UPI00240A4D4F|nr:LOW QUALITY PROTEIN: putative E3 ubiquitin-protein ligase UBR7 [Uloborus diversus]